MTTPIYITIVHRRFSLDFHVYNGLLKTVDAVLILGRYVPAPCVTAGYTRINTGAQRALGSCYKDGLGVAKDASAAAAWWEKAVVHGDIPSLTMLGTLYERGIGVGQDGERAFALYKQAADLGEKRTRAVGGI
jgi:TPR repeat protein